MPFTSRHPFVALTVLFLALPAFAVAQTVQGDVLRGGGAYLRGLGWYNFNTARANSINADTMIRWKSDLRKIQQERRVLDAQAKYEKKLKIEDVRQQQAERERLLRTSASAADVHRGDALDVLLFDLTDPDITTELWQSRPVSLPDEMSVKDMIFRFTPLTTSSKTSVALGRGVIALSRLDIEGKWPISLAMKELEPERMAYERAYAKVRDEVVMGTLDVKSLLELDASLDRLKASRQDS